MVRFKWSIFQFILAALFAVGPMVYATCFGPISRKNEIERQGFAGEFIIVRGSAKLWRALKCVFSYNSIALFRSHCYVDSKQLSEKQRDALFGCICSSSDLLGWKAEILSPNDISNGMLQRCVQ